MVPLWFVFACGISGYWLAWDKLAQFVAIATTEWLDALPLFGEPIARNFLDNATLSGRFFMLMVFLHIAVLLLRWGFQIKASSPFRSSRGPLHQSRGPKARDRAVVICSQPTKVDLRHIELLGFVRYWVDHRSVGWRRQKRDLSGLAPGLSSRYT